MMPDNVSDRANLKVVLAHLMSVQQQIVIISHVKHSASKKVDLTGNF